MCLMPGLREIFNLIAGWIMLEKLFEAMIEFPYFNKGSFVK